MNLDRIVQQITSLIPSGTELRASLWNDVANELDRKAAGSIAKATLDTTWAIGKALRARLKKTKAIAEFDKEWSVALTTAERERALRRFIRHNPSLEKDLTDLFSRRDYMIALRSFCQQLPFLAVFFPCAQIDDVFVDVRVSGGTHALTHDNVASLSTLLLKQSTDPLTAHQIGNLALLGPPGAGKSTFSRLLTARVCDTILRDPELIDNRTSRLPVYVAAKDIVDVGESFLGSIREAVARQLHQFLPEPLAKDFFSSENGKSPRHWLVIVDAVDEIADQPKRLELIRAVRALSLSGSNTFNFIITCRSGVLPDRVFEDGFHCLQLKNLTHSESTEILRKYATQLGIPSNVEPLKPAEFLPDAPLYLVISLVVFNDTGQTYGRLIELFSSFIQILLQKRGFSDPTSFVQLVVQLATSRPISISDELIAHAEALGFVPRGKPKFETRLMLEDIFVSSGLLTRRAKSIEFIHSSFDSYFRAIDFADHHPPNNSVWKILDPFKNGWDFAQFVLERWSSAGKEVGPACQVLLSYDDPGLRLFSRTCATSPNLPKALIRIAVAKWLEIRDREGEGVIDGPLQQLQLIARNYEEGVTALKKIARDDWEYGADSVEASKLLAEIGYVDEAKKELIRILQRKDGTGYPPDQASAAEALCDIGFPDDGKRRLAIIVDHWLSEPDEENFLGILISLQALNRFGHKKLANDGLNRLSQLQDLDELHAEWVVNAYGKFGRDSDGLAFLEHWLDQNGHSSMRERVLKIAAADLAQLDLSEALESDRRLSQYSQKIEKALDHLCQQSSRTGVETLTEIANNRYIDPEIRVSACARLRTVSLDLYRSICAGMLSDPALKFHQIKNISDELNRAGFRPDVVEGLRRSLSTSRAAPVSNAKLLVECGDKSAGVAYLKRVAFDPAWGASSQTDAIVALTQIGESETGLACLKRAIMRRFLTAPQFTEAAQALQLTEKAYAIEELLWSVLSDFDCEMAFRLAASKLLYSPELSSDAKYRITKFLCHAAERKELHPSLRLEAIDQWHDLEPGWAEEICDDIASDPKTPLELGLQAARAV